MNRDLMTGIIKEYEEYCVSGGSIIKQYCLFSRKKCDYVDNVSLKDSYLKGYRMYYNVSGIEKEEIILPIELMFAAPENVNAEIYKLIDKEKLELSNDFKNYNEEKNEELKKMFD